MYHSVSDDEEPHCQPYFRLCTKRSIFRRHLEILKALGYRAISLGALMEEFSRAPTTDHQERLVVITFDDGFANNIDAAYPELANFGFTATVFLPTAYIGDERRHFLGRACLTWSEARDLLSAGFEIGSHTVNHPRLAEASPPTLVRELTDSKETIEDALGHRVIAFSHPYGFPSADRPYIRRYRDAVRSAGYECAVTTRIGCAQRTDSRFELPRLPANSADDEAFFRAKIVGDYDWLEILQSSYKCLKQAFSLR